VTSTPIACPREKTDKRRVTTTNSSSSHHHDSAPSRPHSLICTGAEPFHPVHASSQLGCAAVAPRNRMRNLIHNLIPPPLALCLSPSLSLALALAHSLAGSRVLSRTRARSLSLFRSLSHTHTIPIPESRHAPTSTDLLGLLDNCWTKQAPDLSGMRSDSSSMF